MLRSLSTCITSRWAFHVPMVLPSSWWLGAKRFWKNCQKINFKFAISLRLVHQSSALILPAHALSTHPGSLGLWFSTLRNFKFFQQERASRKDGDWEDRAACRAGPRGAGEEGDPHSADCPRRRRHRPGDWDGLGGRHQQGEIWGFFFNF